jgi:hypothetical protein
MNRRNPVCIEQSREVPALDAPAELLSQELAKVAEHQGYGKARYRVLKAKFKQLFRRTVADAQTVEVGREIERQKDEIQKNKAQAKRNARTAAELGVTIPKDRAGTETLALNLNRFKSALEAAEAEAEKEHI